tara:strand:+ start:58 stop:555 length:498 start_codon:yes stop_codon:yes gene_type:complete
MRLTKNFTLHELTKSDTALRLGLSNSPTKEGIIKLRLLATHLLQPLRNEVGSIRITSGYRSPSLSQAIGSNQNSQHCRYEAIDCQLVKRGKMNNIEIFNALIRLNLDFDQCILEFGDSTEFINPNYPAWIHLSWKVCDNRQETLVAYKNENNTTKYRPYLQYKSL